MVNNPNWQEADQLAIYKHGRGVELGALDFSIELVTKGNLTAVKRFEYSIFTLDLC